MSTTLKYAFHEKYGNMKSEKSRKNRSLSPVGNTYCLCWDSINKNKWVHTSICVWKHMPTKCAARSSSFLKSIYPDDKNMHLPWNVSGKLKEAGECFTLKHFLILITSKIHTIKPILSCNYYWNKFTYNIFFSYVWDKFTFACLPPPLIYLLSFLKLFTI